ncbi:MAG: hypothetical protein IPM82_10145 [Saprospiraceae bacterium]|nr:hypothetical protein [Saprospiraceae bacterium]
MGIILAFHLWKALKLKDMHEQPIALKIKRIEIINSVLNTPVMKEEITEFNFDINVRQGINTNDKFVLSIVEISISSLISKQFLGKYEAAFTFELEDFDKLFSDTQTVDVPEHLAMAVNSISISTMRGLMFAAYKGTYLHNAILPLINPQSLQPSLVN